MSMTFVTTSPTIGKPSRRDVTASSCLRPCICLFISGWFRSCEEGGFKPSSLAAIASDRTLDEDGGELCRKDGTGSAGAARLEVEDEIASVAKKRDELGVILMMV